MAAPSVLKGPRKGEVIYDRTFRWLTRIFAWATILLLAGIVLRIGEMALPAMDKYGLGFITETSWNAPKEEFGILSHIFGTLYTSFIALLFGGVLGVTAAIFISQGFLPPSLEKLLKNIVELLAAIPSVVYGLWGIFVVIPAITPAARWVHEHMGGIPFFSTEPIGPGFLPASLVLSIMILPTIMAVSREALVAVPKKIKEASFGIGATRWQTILHVTLPTASTGVFGSIVLGFGRALGETMALAMLVGSANQISFSIFSPGHSLATLLANHFPEAGKMEVGALMYAALVLLLITLVVNLIGALIMNRASAGTKGLN